MQPAALRRACLDTGQNTKAPQRTVWFEALAADKRGRTRSRKRHAMGHADKLQAACRMQLHNKCVTHIRKGHVTTYIQATPEWLQLVHWLSCHSTRLAPALFNTLRPNMALSILEVVRTTHRRVLSTCKGS